MVPNYLQVYEESTDAMNDGKAGAVEGLAAHAHTHTHTHSLRRCVGGGDNLGQPLKASRRYAPYGDLTYSNSDHDSRASHDQ